MIMIPSEPINSHFCNAFSLSVTPILFLPFSRSQSGGKQDERVINVDTRQLGEKYPVC